MNLPPMLVRIKIKTPQLWFPTLWIPVGLIWPLLALLALPIVLLGALLTLIVHSRDLPRLWRLAQGVYAVLCESRGIKVDVDSHDARVFVTIH